MGVDAYRGATQLNLIEPENWDDDKQHYSARDLRNYPQEARYLIDHVLYLPVNKSVPFHVLDYICRTVERADMLSRTSTGPTVMVQAKL
jgi:perosamine synthetase